MRRNSFINYFMEELNTEYCMRFGNTHGSLMTGGKILLFQYIKQDCGRIHRTLNRSVSKKLVCDLRSKFAITSIQSRVLTT
jgi:hypothetical protein